MPCWNFVRRWLQGYQHETHWWLKSDAWTQPSSVQLLERSSGPQKIELKNWKSVRVDKFSHIYTKASKNTSWREKFSDLFFRRSTSFFTKHIMFVDTLLEGFGTVFPDTVRYIHRFGDGVSLGASNFFLSIKSPKFHKFQSGSRLKHQQRSTGSLKIISPNPREFFGASKLAGEEKSPGKTWPQNLWMDWRYP